MVREVLVIRQGGAPIHCGCCCQCLQFTWGVHGVFEPEHPEDWKGYIGRWLADHGVPGELAVLTEGPSSKHPDANHRMEIVDLTAAKKL